MSTLTRKTTLGVVAALVALAAAGGAAEAGKHKKKHFFFIGDPYHHCGFYKHKWLMTGKPFWKWKYYECKGWW